MTSPRMEVGEAMPRIVFLCRGHGYGHAARDLAIIEAVRQMCDAEVLVASSGTGLDYFQRRDVVCADLRISDEEDQQLDAARKVLSFLGEVGRPDLVIADEIFCAPALCRGLGVRNLLLTDFFWGEVGRPHLDQVYDGADAVILLDSPETHRVPAGIGIPVHVTGPVVRRFAVTRRQARAELEVPANAFVVTAAFGSPHQNKPSFVRTMLRTLLTAWEAHAKPSDQLLVLADPPTGVGTGGPGVCWVGVTNRPEIYYCGADLVVAWVGFAALSELVANDIPAVCFTGDVESLDMRKRTEYVESAGRIRRADLNVQPDELWRLSELVRADHASQPGTAQVFNWAEPDDVARLLLDYL